jgi:hypothetical protein
MKKRYTTDEILEGLKGIQKAEPNPFLFTRIEAKIANEVNVGQLTKWSLVFAALATMLLITLNIWAVTNFNSKDYEQSNSYNLSYFQSY